MDASGATSTGVKRDRKPLWVGLGVAAVLVFALAMVLFQPWKLFTNVEVNEGNPLAAGGQPSASGTFSSGAHPTTGNVRIGTAADGSKVVFLENLKTDNGPDLKLYLATDAGNPVNHGVNLGDLKGNQGNQAYAVPAGTDLTKAKSVVIWCERFSVAFGTASLATSG